jgi:hypothetical protein
MCGPILIVASGMFINQAGLVFIFSERARIRGALLDEPGFTESHSRQIVIAVIMDTPNRMRKVGSRSKRASCRQRVKHGF